MFAELALGSAINFQHAVWRAIALKDDIHRTSNAMLKQQFGCSKSLFIFEVIGNYRLPGAQCEPGWGFKIGANGRRSDDTLMPTDARADKQSIFCRDVLQDLAELRLHSLGGKTRSVIQQLDKRLPL